MTNKQNEIITNKLLKQLKKLHKDKNNLVIQRIKTKK